MIVSFLDSTEIPTADVCVVGAGPVGLAVVLACEAAGLSVLLVESGPAEPDAFSAGLSAGHRVDPTRHVAPEVAICRALGGTSRWWGGRCVPFDDVDFVPRPHVPEAGWPFPHDEVRRWYGDACDYFGIGPPDFVDAPGSAPTLHGVLFNHLEKWTPEIDMGRRHRDRLLACDRVMVVLGATVTDLRLSASGNRLTGVTLAAPGRQTVIAPKATVLACGGLETSRLLLWVRERHPAAFGGQDGPLGRSYVGHISGKIAEIVLADPQGVADHDFFLKDGGFRRRRFMISEATQLREGLLNAAFWVDNPPFNAAAHGSGLLSLVWLALAVPFVGRRVLSEGVRRSHVGPPPHQWGRHLLNVLRSPLQTAIAITDVIRSRFLIRPKKPGFLIRNRNGRYALHYHAEHAPNPASRVTLSSRQDALGVPFLDVALEFTERDAESVVRSHEALDRALRGAGVGRLEYRLPARVDLLKSVAMQASDGFHQIGLTRMSASPGSGVVDANCRVHGVDNLFIAGSSVFPSSGQANPTLVAVALALRLAGHLVDNARQGAAGTSAQTTVQEAA
jgi:choline dehydrogenase-like flavoprotein